MATYVLIHGAGSDAWYWHRVAPLLQERGHDVVAVDLPAADDAAGLDAYVEVVLDAIGDRRDLVVVGQSLGALTAALVPAHRPVDLLVFLNGMIPAPGERGGEWWGNTGLDIEMGDDFDPIYWFVHDVPQDVLAAGDGHNFPQSGTPMGEPWPLDRLPDVPTRAIIGRDDRFFPVDWMTGVVRDRLGIEPDVVPGAHTPALSYPAELVDALERIRTETLEATPA